MLFSIKLDADMVVIMVHLSIHLSIQSLHLCMQVNKSFN